jgi:hypothetical protein
MLLIDLRGVVECPLSRPAGGSGGYSRFGSAPCARRVSYTRDTLLGCPVEELAMSGLRGLRQIEYESAVVLLSTGLRSARCQIAGRRVS